MCQEKPFYLRGKMVSKLVKKGIASVRPYVPGKPIEVVKRELGLKDVIKLASNENPLGPSPLALQALREAIYQVHLYPEDGGPQLREAIAQRLGVSPQEIILGSGSVEIIQTIDMAFLNPGEKVVISDPSFALYLIAAQVAGGKEVLIPLKDWKHDLEAMAKAVDGQTKLLFIDNPINPVGTMVTKGELEPFMERIPEETIVILDEAYHEFQERDDYPDSLQWVRKGHNVIVLRTFSKIYGLAGLRLGYGVAKREIVALLNQVRLPFNVNLLALRAAMACLGDEEHVLRTRELNREEKGFLYEELDRMRVEYIPSETNFIMIELGQDAQSSFQEFLKQGVIVRPLGGYGLPTKIRLTVGKREENEAFIRSLKRIIKGRS